MTQVFFSFLFFFNVCLIGVYAQSLTVIWPKHNEVISDRMPLMSWNGIEGIEIYQVSLAQDSTFTSGLLSYTSSNAQFQLSNNLISGTWFWKVNGAFNGQTYFSNVGKFQVFEPSDIPNLVVWLSSDSSVVLDANNRVSSWNNLVGTNHFVNANASSRPFITNPLSSMNQNRAIDFQGNEVMSSVNNFSFGNASVFVVGSQSAGEPVYGRFLDHAFNTGFWIGRNNSSDAFGGGFIEPLDPYGNYTSLQNEKPIQISLIRNLATTNYFANSNSFVNPSRTTSSTNTVPNKIHLAGMNGNPYGKKRMYNIVIYGINLDNNQRKLVERYQMDKYAPPVNLGADITPNYQNNGVCINEIVTVSSMYTNFLWSTGATTQSIQITQPGSYWVQTIDIFGRTSRDTVVVNNPKMNIFNFQDTLICFNNSITITPNLPTNHSIVSWSNGNNNLSQNFNGQDNNQHFNVLFQNNSGCIVQSNKFKIIVDSSLFGISIGQDTSLCTGNSIQLQNPPLNIAQYLWNTGNNQTTQIVDTSGLYILEVTNFNGCQNSDTIEVVISGEGPQVSLDLPSTLCQGDTSLFVAAATISSPESIATISWDFGDGIFNNGDSVLVSYQNAGSKNIEVSVLASNGCSVNLNQPIQINPNPNVQIQTVGSCLYDTIVFSTLNSDFNIQTYNWNLGQNTSSNSLNPTHVYNIAGTYSINVHITDLNGCQSSSQTSIVLSEELELYNNSLTVIWPKHNEVISDRTPLLIWNGIDGIQSYHISLSQDSTFSSGVQTFASSITQLQLSNNLISGTWFWRLSGVVNGQTYFSNVGKFQVFDPTDIPNLVVWLSSDSSVVLDANNRVSSWNNLVGSNHFVNSNSSSRPFITSPLSNMNQNRAIDFQGNEVLSSLNNFSFGNASILVVGSQSAGEPINGRLIDHAFNTGFWVGRNGTSNGMGGGFIEPSEPYGNYTNIQNDQPIQLSLIRSSSITSYFSNTNPFINPNRTTSSAITASNKIHLAGANGSPLGKKKLYNLLIYSFNVNDSQRKLIEKFQMDKYAPPVNLGADITPSNQNNGTCINETVSASTIYSSYLWSTGATTQSIQVTQSGSYWVQTTDIFGRSSRDTIVVNNPKMNIFDFQDTIVCFNITTNITPEIPSNLSFIKWNNCNPNLTNEIKPNNSYFIELTDNQGCIIKSNLFSVGIDSSLANFTLGADTNLCSGNTIQLQNTPVNITQFSWNTGNNQASQIVDTSGLYMLEVTNSNNCQNRDTIQVNVIGTSPILNYSFPSSICQFSEGQYNDSSEVPNGNGTINNKTWSISEGSSYSGSSGAFVIDSAGTFNVTLLVETEQGCSSSTTFPLTVHPKPILSFTTQNYCPYEAVEFTPTNSALAILNYQFWQFGDNSTSNNINPTHVFGSSGVYNTTLEAQDINGCRDTVMQAVYIQPAPVAAFLFNNTCEETAVNFVNNSNIADTLNITTNTWTYGDGTQEINPSFQKIYADADTFDVQLIVTANNGCQDTLTQTITIYPKPILDWQVGPACKNTWTTFENLSSVSVGNISQTDWLVNLQYPLEGTSSAYQFVTTGVQYLNLTSTTDNGCQRDTLIIVNVQPEINAAYTISPQTIVAGVPTSFTSTSTGAAQYTWNLGDNNPIQTSNSEPVEIQGFDSSLIGDSIQTSLIIENTIGCRDTATQYIKVYEPRIDLAITQLFVQDLNGFYKVGVELRNQGFVEITNTDLLLKMYGSMPIMETETESLAPGESRIYLFNASPSAYISTQDNETSYLCVEATSYNDYQLIETELSNNISCLNTEGGNFVLLPIYPNPTNDDITYTLIVSEESTIITSLTDETGRIVQSSTELFASGLHTPTLSMRNLRAGVYYFQISDGVTSKTVKVLKN